MKIDIIGMPIYYGCDTLGADLAYDTLNDRKIEAQFKKHEIINRGKIEVDSFAEKYKDNNRLKFVEAILDSNKTLYYKVTDILRENHLPLTIGGDHSSVIGSISAVLDHYKDDVTVIWIDSHADIHTDQDTPSFNLHGLPVAILMGMCDDKLKIGNYTLKPSNFIYIGLSNYEEEEMDRIKRNKIKYYTDKDVSNIGVKRIIKEIIKEVKTKYVHISFDVDSFTYDEFKAVNVAGPKTYLSSGGIAVEDGLLILKKLLLKFKVSSIDIVEYNPLFDDKEDIVIVERLLNIIDKHLK